MEVKHDLKRAICSLFDVYQDPDGVQRVVTPLEYSGSGDRIVVRVRPAQDGVTIDENGEAALYASLAGGDVESEAIGRWSEELKAVSPVEYTPEETLSVFAGDDRLVAPYVFRVAEAAQQLHALATARADRKTSDFKYRVAEIVHEVAKRLNRSVASDVELPIAGGLRADHVVDLPKPMIVIAAPSAARLLEAEVIYMQYRAEQMPGLVLAIAESQIAVGRKQFERAGYYTSRTVAFSPDALQQLVSAEIQNQH
jgi:hypothetical protein